MLRSAVVTALVVMTSGAVAAKALAKVTETASVEDLRKLSIEELGNIEITSVSKRAQPLSQAPAAIYVITRDDIRRSGADSLPEALRLAPNLQVSRAEGGLYGITARGFNDQGITQHTSNKLLVLIDGRTVYTPLHSGVFWDQQLVMLDDIERIEVISGPGGTLWGANAVNGVINVITRKSQDTEGGLAGAHWGNVDHYGNVRYGVPIGDDGALRVYGQGFDYGPNETRDGGSAHDGYHGVSSGFRSDFGSAAQGNTGTFQGDYYRAPYDAGGAIMGGNLLGRANHQFEQAGDLQLQGYFDTARRERVDGTGNAPRIYDRVDTFDVEMQHTFRPANANEVVWGLGQRVIQDTYDLKSNAQFLRPQNSADYLSNLFAQDTITLADPLKLTLGSKFEYSTFSGTEVLPSARLAYSLSPETLLWGAVSRAARSPSRIESDLVITGALVPAPDYDAEKLTAFELGYRGMPFEETTASVNLYYNRYDDLRTVQNIGGVFQQQNRGYGETHGAEAWADHQLLDWWRLSAGANVLFKNLTVEDGTVESPHSSFGRDPSFQYSFRSRMDLPNNVEFDLGIREVDALMESLTVGDYLSLDTRLGWNPLPNLELSISAENLLDDRHPEEDRTTAIQREVGRSWMANVVWKF